MKLLIVEPHPDDAFLSLGWHLKKLWPDKGTECSILTVYHDDRRGKEAERYAESVKARWFGLGLDESKMLSETEKVGKVTELKTWLDEHGGEFSRVVFPLGLQHPDHLRVAATRPPGAWRYLDTPYCHKLKLQELVWDKSEGMAVVSMTFPPKHKWKAKDIFKSQAKFFYYNENLAEYRAPEVVLCPP